jgi:hypothetical protein
MHFRQTVKNPPGFFYIGIRTEFFRIIIQPLHRIVLIIRAINNYIFSYVKKLSNVILLPEAGEKEERLY